MKHLFLAMMISAFSTAEKVTISNTECRKDVDGNLMDTHDGNIVQWETDDTNPFWFNDAGNQPHEGISQRHATSGQNKSGHQDVGGSATVGIVSGAAINLTYKKFYAMAQTNGRPPVKNDIWWGSSSR